MLYYILRRFGLFFTTAFILTLIAFSLHSWLTEIQSSAYLDDYFVYMLQIFKGNWGISIIDQQPILMKGVMALASTLELCLFASIAALLIAVPLGAIAGIQQNSNIDYVIMSIALLTLAIPVFWIALMMTTIPNTFNIELPIDGQISPLFEIPSVTGFMLVDSLLVSDTYHFDAFFNRIQHLILPAIALSLFIFAEAVRLTRHSISTVMKSNYVKASYSKGFSTWHIVRTHVLKNIYPLIIHELRSQLSVLISFAMTVEIVFSLNGTGNWLLSSINEGDYIVLPTAILLIGGFTLLTSILIDIFLMLTSPTKRRLLYVD